MARTKQTAKQTAKQKRTVSDAQRAAMANIKGPYSQDPSATVDNVTPGAIDTLWKQNKYRFIPDYLKKLADKITGKIAPTLISERAKSTLKAPGATTASFGADLRAMFVSNNGYFPFTGDFDEGLEPTAYYVADDLPVTDNRDLLSLAGVHSPPVHYLRHVLSILIRADKDEGVYKLFKPFNFRLFQLLTMDKADLVGQRVATSNSKDTAAGCTIINDYLSVAFKTEQELIVLQDHKTIFPRVYARIPVKAPPAPAPAKTPAQAQAPAPAKIPDQAQAPAPAKTPAQAQAPAPAKTPAQAQAPAPAKTPDQAQAAKRGAQDPASPPRPKRARTQRCGDCRSMQRKICDH